MVKLTNLFTIGVGQHWELLTILFAKHIYTILYASCIIVALSSPIDVGYNKIL